MRIPAPLLAAVALAAAVGAASTAEACSCQPYASAAAQVEASDLIFRGRVVTTRWSPGGEDGLVDAVIGGIFARRTSFEVLESLKGDAGAAVGVRHFTENMCGGVQFEGGAIHLIFAYRDGESFATDRCRRAQFTEDEYRAAIAAGGIGGAGLE